MEKSKIHVVYESCHAIFSQKGLPTFQQIQHLKDLLDRIEAKNVGIDEFGLCDSAISIQEGGGRRGLLYGRSFLEITYIHIHECDSFSIGVFCLPAGKVFPLHDHPGMTVLSKLLYGSVYVKANWILLPAKNQTAEIKELVKIVVDAVGLAGRVIDGIIKAPKEASVLFPASGGNIHGFTALTPCAILDLLSSPYSEDFGRPSTYFSDFPLPSPSLSGYSMLEAKPVPTDLIVRGAPYLGPPIEPQYHSYQ